MALFTSLSHGVLMGDCNGERMAEIFKSGASLMLAKTNNVHVIFR